MEESSLRFTNLAQSDLIYTSKINSFVNIIASVTRLTKVITNLIISKKLIKVYNGYDSDAVKGHLRSKKQLSSNERAWKMQKNEPSTTSMRQMVLEIFHFKVRNLGKMDIAIL